MSKEINFDIEQHDVGKRLDVVVSENCSDLSRSSIKSLEIDILVNSKIQKLSYKVKNNDKISFVIPTPKKIDLRPRSDIEFEIVYIDDDIVVVNKPYNLTVHPSKGHEDDTLVNGLLYKIGDRLSSIGGEERPGIVHRLDKDTAGLLVIALNDKSHRKLADDFKYRRVMKIYHAIVKGYISPEKDTINAPIGRSLRDRKKMAVVDNGKPATTEYKVIEYIDEHSYVEINLLTGRTHQIRVHFASRGFPIAGDPIYSRGKNKYNLRGIALCAKKLEFRHPISDKLMAFEIDLPDDFASLLGKLKTT